MSATCAPAIAAESVVEWYRLPSGDRRRTATLPGRLQKELGVDLVVLVDVECSHHRLRTGLTLGEEILQVHGHNGRETCGENLVAWTGRVREV